jgi:hypothetical protein
MLARPRDHDGFKPFGALGERLSHQTNLTRYSNASISVLRDGVFYAIDTLTGRTFVAGLTLYFASSDWSGQAYEGFGTVYQLLIAPWDSPSQNPGTTLYEHSSIIPVTVHLGSYLFMGSCVAWNGGTTDLWPVQTSTH